MEELLLKLYEKDIKISVDHHYKLNLKINGNDDIKDIIEEVRINKQPLIDYINSLKTNKGDTSSDILEDTLSQLKFQETYKTTPQQKREFLRYLIIGKYSFNTVFKIELIDSDDEIIRKVIHQLISRHEILRTTFLIKDKEIRQKIHPDISDDFMIDYVNLTELTNKDEAFSEEFEELKTRSFDFEKGPLIAVKIVEYDTNIKGVLFSIHHIISDIISVDIITKEIKMLYEFFRKEEQEALPILNLQSKEYASWINNYMKSSSGKNKADQYREKIRQNLKEDSTLDSFKKDSYVKKLKRELDIALGEKDREELPDFFGNIYNIYPEPGALYQNFIRDDQMRKLREIARIYKSSLFNTLVAISAIAFYRKNKNKSIRIAIPHSGRLLQEFENIIGWFASEMVLCLSVKENLSVKELIGSVSDELLETSKYSFYPYEKIMMDLDLNLSTLAPMFINYHVHNERYNFEMAPLHRSKGSGHFAFGCDFIQYDNCIKMMINYNIKHFSGIEVQQLVEDYNLLIDQLFLKPDILINELFVEQRKNLL